MLKPQPQSSRLRLTTIPAIARVHAVCARGWKEIKWRVWNWILARWLLDFQLWLFVARQCENDDGATIGRWTQERDMKRRKVIIYILILSFLLLALGGLDACWTFPLLLRSSLPYVKRDDDIKYKYVIITNWSCVLCKTSHCMRLDFINCRCYLKQQQPKWWMEISQN